MMLCPSGADEELPVTPGPQGQHLSACVCGHSCRDPLLRHLLGFLQSSSAGLTGMGGCSEAAGTTQVTVLQAASGLSP